MAETIDSIPTSTPPASRRRTLFAAAGAVIMGSGITSGVAASVADLVPLNPDADLLAFRLRLDTAVRDVGYTEMHERPSGMSDHELDEWVSQTGQELENVCWAIVEAPAAQTAEGRALKAAAAMHQLKAAHCHGSWPGAGESQAWDVLSEIAGTDYVPSALPERIRHLCEPART